MKERRRAPRYPTRLCAVRTEPGSERYHWLTDISATGLAYVDWLLDPMPGEVVELAVGGIPIVGRVVRVSPDGKVGIDIVAVDQKRYGALIEHIAFAEEETKPTHICA